jgi:hypothetical protein
MLHRGNVQQRPRHVADVAESHSRSVRRETMVVRDAAANQCAHEQPSVLDRRPMVSCPFSAVVQIASAESFPAHTLDPLSVNIALGAAACLVYRSYIPPPSPSAVLHDSLYLAVPVTC